MHRCICSFNHSITEMKGSESDNRYSGSVAGPTLTLASQACNYQRACLKLRQPGRASRQIDNLGLQMKKIVCFFFGSVSPSFQTGSWVGHVWPTAALIYSHLNKDYCHNNETPMTPEIEFDCEESSFIHIHESSAKLNIMKRWCVCLIWLKTPYESWLLTVQLYFWRHGRFIVVTVVQVAVWIADHSVAHGNF